MHHRSWFNIYIVGAFGLYTTVETSPRCPTLKSSVATLHHRAIAGYLEKLSLLPQAHSSTSLLLSRAVGAYFMIQDTAIWSSYASMNTPSGRCGLSAELLWLSTSTTPFHAACVAHRAHRISLAAIVRLLLVFIMRHNSYYNLNRRILHYPSHHKRLRVGMCRTIRSDLHTILCTEHCCLTAMLPLAI